MPVERPALRLEPLTAVFQSPPDPTAINIDIESPAPEVDIESTVPEADIKPPAPEVDAAPLATSARAPATVPAIPRFKSVRDIGFYNCLELEGRSYHVQTEIIPGTTPKIQTNVVQGGAVLKSELQSLGENPDVVESTKRANAQHEQAVEAVRRGELNS